MVKTQGLCSSCICLVSLYLLIVVAGTSPDLGVKLQIERQNRAEHRRLAQPKEWCKPIQFTKEIRVQYIGEMVTTN